MHCLGTACGAHAITPSQGGREETTLPFMVRSIFRHFAFWGKVRVAWNCGECLPSAHWCGDAPHPHPHIVCGQAAQSLVCERGALPTEP